MINMQIKVDTRTTEALFGEQLPKALPYLEASMLTRLANGAGAAVRRQMPVDFDRPTDFTVRSVRVEGAKPTNRIAEVFIPESVLTDGQMKREYLQPGVAGSPRRRQKRTEYLLSRLGFLPAGWVTTPGSATGKLGMIDNYGNLRPRIYAQVINVLQLKRVESSRARGVSARSQARAKKMGVQSEWFAVAPGKNAMGRSGSWLPPGVYRRAGKGGETLQQILKFVKAASYRPRLDFVGTVRKHVDSEAQAAWTAASSAVFRRFNEAK